VELFSGCSGTSLGCSTTGSTYPTYGEVTSVRPSPAETLYARVTADADVAGKFNICARVSPVSGVGELSLVDAFEVFTDPASDVINVHYVLTQGELITISLYDIRGMQKVILQQSVQSAGDNHSLLHLPFRLAGGVYLIALESGGKRAVQRIVILN
jgi:hypothetical protein